MNTAFTIKPIPIVSTTTVSLRIAARTKNVMSDAHINRTRSIGGILSVTPAMTARNVGITAARSKTSPTQPIDSAVLGFSLLLKKSLIYSFVFEKRSIQSAFVEDVFSNFGDSDSFPTWVDVVCMIV